MVWMALALGGKGKYKMNLKEIRALAKKTHRIAEQLHARGTLSERTFFEAISRENIFFKRQDTFFVHSPEPTQAPIPNREPDSEEPKNKSRIPAGSSYFNLHVIAGAILVLLREQPDRLEDCLLYSYLKISNTRFAIRICIADEVRPVLMKEFTGAMPDELLTL